MEKNTALVAFFLTITETPFRNQSRTDVKLKSSSFDCDFLTIFLEVVTISRKIFKLKRIKRKREIFIGAFLICFFRG